MKWDEMKWHEMTWNQMNQWINEGRKEGTKERTNEGMKWKNERMKEGKNEWMKEKVTNDIKHTSHYFVEVPIPQANSSPSYLFTELLLHWDTLSLNYVSATSSLSCLLSGLLASALSHQLQSCIPLEWHHVQKLPLPRLFNAFRCV